MSLIAAISGVVQDKTLDHAHLAVGGMVFAVAAPLPALAGLTRGAPATLHTHLIVREDDLALYGFASAEERDLFVTLIGVSGVGPRLGLAMLSTHSAGSLAAAIANEDADTLARTPGIGKKLALRIVLDLKAAMQKRLAGSPDLAATAGAGGGATRERDVIDALTGLGYTPAEALAALRKVPDSAAMPLDELIVRALRQLAR